jgi:hypothetical protein
MHACFFIFDATASRPFNPLRTNRLTLTRTGSGVPAPVELVLRKTGFRGASCYLGTTTRSTRRIGCPVELNLCGIGFGGRPLRECGYAAACFAPRHDNPPPPPHAKPPKAHRTSRRSHIRKAGVHLNTTLIPIRASVPRSCAKDWRPRKYAKPCACCWMAVAR